jgi:hypothetical protein
MFAANDCSIFQSCLVGMKLMSGISDLFFKKSETFLGTLTSTSQFTTSLLMMDVPYLTFVSASLLMKIASLFDKKNWPSMLTNFSSSFWGS